MPRPKPLKALRMAHNHYKKLNVDRAHRLLDLEGLPKYLGAFYAGLTGVLGIATLFGSVIATILSAAAFASLTMTPVGWVVISTGFVATVVVVGINQYYKFLASLKELKEKRKDYLQLDGQVLALEKKIQIAYENLDYVKLNLKDLGISDESITEQTDSRAGSHAANPEPENELESQETNSSFIWDIFSRAKKIFYKCTVVPLTYIAKKLHLPQFMNFLAEKFPIIAKLINDIHDAVQPYITKILEFSSIYGTVVAAMSGILSGIAKALGISIAKMGLVSVLTSVLAAVGVVVSGPVAFGIIVAVGAMVATSLFINKIFYNDPLSLLLSEFKHELSVLPTTLAHNTLILSAAEAQLGQCQAKINEKHALLKAEELQAQKLALETALAAAQPKKEGKPATTTKRSCFMSFILSFSGYIKPPKDTASLTGSVITPIPPVIPVFGQSFSDSHDPAKKVAANSSYNFRKSHV